MLEKESSIVVDDNFRNKNETGVITMKKKL